MKEFLNVLRRFVWPYKKFVALSVVFNVLSALLNIFSFAALIPILQILFKTGDHVEVKELMAWGSGSFKDVAINNIYYYINQFIGEMGSTTTLLFIGLFLAFTTALKTGAYMPESLKLLSVKVSFLCHDTVKAGTCMSLGKNKSVPVRILRISGIYVHLLHIEICKDLSGRKGSARMSGFRVIDGSDNVLSHLIRCLF